MQVKNAADYEGIFVQTGYRFIIRAPYVGRAVIRIALAGWIGWRKSQLDLSRNSKCVVRSVVGMILVQEGIRLGGWRKRNVACRRIANAERSRHRNIVGPAGRIEIKRCRAKPFTNRDVVLQCNAGKLRQQ